MVKSIYLSVLSVFIIGMLNIKTAVAQTTSAPVSSQILPIDGNTWQVSGKSSRNGGITKGGIQNWNNQEASFKSFFRITKPGILKLWINAAVTEGASILEVS